MTRLRRMFQIPRACTHQVLQPALHRSQRRLTGFKRPTVTLLVLMLALGVGGPTRAEESISVRIEGQRLEALSNDPAATMMVIRVAGPRDFFNQARDESGWIEWVLPPGAADGVYRYDIYAAAPVMQSGDAPADGAGTAGTSYRESGRFWVKNGMIQTPQGGEDEAAVYEGTINPLGRWLVAVVEFFIPAANAQDLTASSGIPTVNYVDTNLVSGTAEVWETQALESTVDCSPGGNIGSRFEIVDMIGFNAAVRICGQGDSDTAVPNFRSIVVDDLGDITLADGDVFVDRSSGEVGIGTVAPDQELHVVTAEFPFIFIEETNGTSNAGIGLLNPGASDTKLIYLRPGGDVFFGDALDSTPAMTWQDATNNIGIGTGTPSTTLHVVGNATFDGTFSVTSSRDAKHGFSKVEPREVLARLETLSISEWSYKQDDEATRHMGPTSEDFHALFGLGQDERHVSPNDLAGVALAAVQGLSSERDIEIKGLKADSDRKDIEIASMKAELDELKAMVRQLAENQQIALIQHGSD